MASKEEDSSRREPNRVVLRLEIEPGGSEEPPTGSIAIEGRPPERFSGWIELMAAVNAARVRGDVPPS
ncbi:MAG TPA: hypothetical protein VGH14_00565 [Solirubrobacterales bacterium]|jgi:hypothetical protein